MLKHFYHKHDDYTIAVYGNTQWLQSFTPDSSFTCTGISLFLSKAGTPSGTLSLTLYLADVNGKPTGAALATASLDYSLLDTVYPGMPLRANFAPGVALVAGTQYVFVLKITAGNSTNCIRITYKMVGDYTGGAAKNSTDGGVTWGDTSNDIIFDAWDANNAGVVEYFACAVVSNLTRIMRLYRDEAGNSTVSWAGFATGNSGCTLRKSANYVYIMTSVGTNSYLRRYDKTGTYDSTFGTKTLSYNYGGLAVSVDDYVAFTLNYTTPRVYLYSPTWTLLYSSAPAITGYGFYGVAIHDTLDHFIYGGGNGSGGWLNAARLKKSDGTARFSYWSNAQTIEWLCFRQSNANSIGCNWAYSNSTVVEHLATSNTVVWSHTMSPAVGFPYDIYHHGDANAVFLACNRVGNNSLFKLSGVNGAQLASFDAGAVTYQIAPLRNGNLLISSLRGADAGGTTCLREMNTNMEVLWRFDSNFNFSLRAACEGFSFPPTIQTESSGGTFDEGETVNLFVTASGSEPLRYQWYKDGDPVDGATLSTYSFSAEKDSAGTYYCIVTNDYGTDQSSDMVIQVQYAPRITAQSGATTALTGVHTTLFIVVDALPAATYQWYKDGNPIPDAEMNTYEFFATYQDAGTYTCVATNLVGEVESGPIAVKVVRNPYYHYNAFNRQIDQDRS